jgi:hypothetical protein
MSNHPKRFSSPSGQLPEDVRKAFLQILFYTLLHVRSHCNQRDVCFTLSDHAHNIPGFLREPTPELLRYYWECEREPFIRQMASLSQPIAVFEPAWTIIGQEYAQLEKPPAT